MIPFNWAKAHRKHARRGLAAAAAAAALLALAVPFGAVARKSYATTLTPGSVTLTQIGSSAEAIASWAYPVSAPPAQETTKLALYRVLAGNQTLVASVGCVGGCTSYQFTNLVPGGSYHVLLAFIINGTWLTQFPTADVTLKSTCASGVCVAVNALQPVRHVDYAGQGLLHSVYPGPDQQFASALKVSMYRGIIPVTSTGLDLTGWSVGSSLNGATTLLISDAWYSANGGNPPAPTASELPAYEQWLTGYITQVLASGARVDYFEPYNEPDLSYYSSTVASTVTADEMYQLFLASYQVIIGLDPAAQIIGPSMGAWVEWPTSGYEAGMNMVDFLKFAAANGIQLAGVSWHEFTEQPRQILQDVAEARQLVSQYPEVGNPKLFINEFGDYHVGRIPGWDVSYLSAVTDSGVDLAGRPCFVNDCWQPDLDGLLTPDGTRSLPDYWVRAFYGSMAGQMVTTSSSDDSMSAIASYDGSSTVDVMLGRGVGCTDTTRCGATAADPAALAGPAPAVAVSTRVSLPWTSGRVSVVGRDVKGASIASYAQPAATVSTTMSVPRSGVITLSVPGFADGDAWTYSIVRN